MNIFNGPSLYYLDLYMKRLCSCFQFFSAATGYLVPFNSLPDHSKQLGLTSSEGALLLSILGIGNTVGRVVAGT